MLTKKYKNGFVTLDAEKFPSVAQETIDREILRANEKGGREVV